MPLKDIVGQPVAIHSLSALVRAGRLPHAMLFHGPSGVGKRTTALALAQAVNCPSADSGDACGECTVCERIARGVDVDVRIYEPGRSEFSRAQAGEMREEAFISPNTGLRKFLILDAAHRITAEAANLLLKVLEEPPETTIFILASDNPHLILPTINSRTIHLPFKPLTIVEMEEALRGRVDQEALPLLYSLSSGNAGTILSLSGDPELGGLHKEIRELLDDWLLNPSRDMSPSLAADKIAAMASRIGIGTEYDTQASRQRKCVVAVLETILSIMESRLLDSAMGKIKTKKGATFSPAANTAAWCGLMENVLDSIKTISGAGNTALTLEVMTNNFRRTAAGRAA